MSFKTKRELKVNCIFKKWNLVDEIVTEWRLGYRGIGKLNNTKSSKL